MLYLAETSQEWWANPVAGPVIAGVILAALAGIGDILRRVLRSVNRVETHVLPHFTPPAPGDPDHTVPGRLARLEDGATVIQQDLAVHTVEEALQRKNDVADRTEQRVRLDERLAAGAQQLDDLKAGQDKITARLDELQGT